MWSDGDEVRLKQLRSKVNPDQLIVNEIRELEGKRLEYEKQLFRKIAENKSAESSESGDKNQDKSNDESQEKSNGNQDGKPEEVISSSSSNSNQSVNDLPSDSTGNSQGNPLPIETDSATNRMGDPAAEMVTKLTEIDERIKKLISKPQIEYQAKLTKAKYRDWAFDMKSDLEFYDLHLFVDSTFDSTVHENALFKRYDRLTRNLICRNIEQTHRDLVENEPTAYAVWEKLRVCLEGSSELKTVKSITEFYTEVGTFSTMENLVRSFRNMVKLLTESISREDKEGVWRTLFLAALPQSYDHLRVTLMAMSSPKLEKFYETALQSSRMRAEQSKTHSMMTNSVTMNNPPGNQGGGCFTCGGPHKKAHCPHRNSNGNGGQRRTDNRSGQRQGGQQGGGQNSNFQRSNNQQQSNGQRQSGNQRNWNGQSNSGYRNNNNNNNYRNGSNQNNRQQNNYNQNNRANNGGGGQNRNQTINVSNLNSVTASGDPESNSNPISNHLSTRFDMAPLFDASFPNSDHIVAGNSLMPGVQVFDGCLLAQLPITINETVANDRATIEDMQLTARACRENVNHLKLKPTDIVMDSGCSHVVTNQDDYIISVRPPSESLNVETADGGKQGIQGFGSMVLKSQYGLL